MKIGDVWIERKNNDKWFIQRILNESFCLSRNKTECYAVILQSLDTICFYYRPDKRNFFIDGRKER